MKYSPSIGRTKNGRCCKTEPKMEIKKKELAFLLAVISILPSSSLLLIGKPSLITSPSRLPPLIIHPSLDSEKELMFVFGGKSNGYHNDIWKFDLGICPPSPFVSEFTWACFPEDNSWEVMTVEKGSRVPARRYGHSGVLYSSEMFIFGGFDCDSFTCSDLWSFSFGTHTSPAISPSLLIPPPQSRTLNQHREEQMGKD